MKISHKRLSRIIREEFTRLWEQAVSFACPPATQDLEINTRNRNSAIEADYIQYGPLNLSDEQYWERAADHWKTTPEVAKQSIEKNEPWETLGYCWMHSFKCHSDRACYTWAAGGPIIEDETSYEWQERNSPQEV